MRDVLTKYKNRLINISSRNRSLVMKKIYKKRAFDLHLINEFNKVFTENLVQYLLERSSKKLIIIDDPYQEQLHEEDKARREAEGKLSRKVEEIKTKIKDFKVFNDKIEEVKATSKADLEKELKRIEKKYEKLIDYSTSLTYLKREIDATEKESGRYELYVGYPFVEGKFLDDTFVKAPLLLFPVRIEKSNNKWYLQNINDDDILINKVFVYAYSKFNEVKIKDFEMQFHSMEEFGDELIERLKDYFAENKIVLQSKKTIIEKFINHSKENEPVYKKGELFIKKYLILGQFPISNSIYSDYQELEKGGIQSPLLEKLLLTEKTYESSKRDNETEGAISKSISEKDVYFLSSLDYSQEKAVTKVNKIDNLVIYGPPGTGKSQTIANIIVDNLARGKRILMVSQKRAALDVVYNRLPELSDKIILLHDANKDKKAFYQKVTNSLDKIKDEDARQKFQFINSMAVEIDKKIQDLDTICNILYQPREFGLTLQQMYSKSKEINSKEDDRFSKMIIFKKENPFGGYKYSELKEASQNVSQPGIIDNFITYKKMLKENSLFSKAKSNLNVLDILELETTVIQELFNALDHIEEVKKKGHYDQIIKIFTKNHFDPSVDEICNVAKKLHKEQNKELLKPINDGRWWSIVYWLNYKKNKQKELENQEQYQQREKQLVEDFILTYQLIKGIVDRFMPLQVLLTSEGWEEACIGILAEDNPASKSIEQIVGIIKDYEKYFSSSIKIGVLTELEEKVLTYCYNNSLNQQELTKTLNNLIEFLILLNISEIEKDLKDELDLLDCSRYKCHVEEVNKLMSEKNTLTPQFINSALNRNFFDVMHRYNIKEFKRQANKQRALWPIRKYLREFAEVTFNLFPCWLMGPETVSEVIPLDEGLFDLIIFDEASQMFVENSIPTIYRGKKVVVAGDDKQLRPSSIFKARYNDLDEEDDLDLDKAAALEEESLLDLAQINFDGIHLCYHYRSHFEELINFSNYAFYNGKLHVTPNIKDSDEPPIKRIKVDGKWLDRKNIKEAEKVVELVSQILSNRESNETIGIITFNITQKDLIEDLLERKANRDAQFRAQYANEINRKDGNEDVSLFVKNIENVQGDERDIIIFSVGYAPNENGKVSVNFGALSQDGGENRLNVAISRAKKKIFVITSIEPEALNVEGAKNQGPRLFKKYLQYAREISNGNKKAATDILYSLVDTGLDNDCNKNHDSDFEAEIYQELIKLGYTVHKQVGVSGYKIDLAVYDPRNSSYLLGIECDGATYHSSKSARERDIHRQRFLESRGWRITRIWSRDWWRNYRKEINKIDQLIKMLRNKQEIKEPTKTNLTLLKTNTAKESSKKIIPRFEEKERHSDRITYGDTVVLQDVQSNEIFEVMLEPNPYNKELMKNIEVTLLGKKLNQRFIYQDYEYIIVKVERLKQIN
ncbi:MAG: AAA domain-containing protein [Peptococcales bacterium]|jgi:very-short-patch-repair endonuclease